MQHFIQGILTGNFEGSTYQDVVYDRVLHVQTRSGKQLEITDMGPSSGHLQVGKTYTFFLAPFYLEEKNVRYYPPEEEVIESAFWEGKIIDLDWGPSQSSDNYECVSDSFMEGGWVLIETSEGYMLMYPRVSKISPSIGGIVQFGNIDFMLHAVQKVT